jgi:hypothetical protein
MWFYIPEGSILNNNRRENLKYYNRICCLFVHRYVQYLRILLAECPHKMAFHLSAIAGSYHPHVRTLRTARALLCSHSRTCTNPSLRHDMSRDNTPSVTYSVSRNTRQQASFKRIFQYLYFCILLVCCFAYFTGHSVQ